MNTTHIQAELGDIATSKAEARRTDCEITLLISVGIAIQDLAAANRAPKMEKAKGLGIMVTLLKWYFVKGRL